MSSEQGISSFDKVYKHLSECLEFKDARALWNARLAAEPDVKYEFNYIKNYSSKAQEQIVTTDFILLTNVIRSRVYVEAQPGLPQWKVECSPNYSGLLTESEAESIVKRNFGTKKCRTYNCKIDKILKGDDRRGHRKSRFAVWARDKLQAENPEAVVEHRSRVIAKTHQILNSEQYAQDKQSYFERQVIDEIRNVVLKYLDRVEMDVIKTAMQEVYVASIMES